ncbi:MAG: polysaccharide pyruvyl transferase family protein [Oscillospiraceae bacterium]|nr:polysaccharide pyruvyl transferase family protein [Oscillospiraceae bacterium]
MKVLTTGLCAEYNFGCPSILHGMDVLLHALHGDNVTMVNYQTTVPDAISVADMNFVTKTNSTDFSTLLKTWKTGKGTAADLELIRDLEEADLVVDLYGICFCDNLEKRKYSYLSMRARKLKFQPILHLAKKMGKTVIKNTASFGPMATEYNKKSAQYSAKNVYDVLCAREVQSKIALRHVLGDKWEVLLSPDTANLMPFSVQLRKNRVGISASHQIVKQWKSAEGYVECIVQLGKVIHEMGAEIVFIPNEYDPTKADNDVAVCKTIQEALAAEGVPSEILDVLHMTSTQLKNEIAACEVVVASRYHTCVAALSSGTPVLVLGWHYKYQELLSLYSQNRWLINQDECDSKKLVEMFRKFWKLREENRQIILNQYPVVRRKILVEGKKMYGGKV